MLKQSLLILSIIFLVGCADKSKSPQGPGKLNKPLPPECESTLQSTINWKSDNITFSYVVSVGLRPYDYFFVETLSGAASEYNLTLDRNLTYFVRVEKQKTNNETITKDISFFIPSCANRLDWKSKNPDYTEPRIDNLEF